MAAQFKHGDKPGYIDYSPEEVACWKVIWNNLEPLLRKHACDEYLEEFGKSLCSWASVRGSP